VLVLRIAEMHGGSVSVESQVGKGSRFTVSLPWSEEMLASTPTQLPVANSAESPTKHVDSNAPLILIAEDSETNIVTLSMCLQSKGYRLAIARNGKEALEMAHQERPAVILMDLQMPILDGLEATRQLRMDNDPNLAHIPIIALTALAMPNDRDRALNAGATEYMSKPANLKQLVAMIERLRTSK
jgi:adenylate cyclase